MNSATLPQKPLCEHVRLTVTRWDSSTLHGTTPEGETLAVSLTQGAPPYPFSRSYLAPLLRKGTQLNIIRPRQSQGVLLPELVIYEPDYLVDVSSVARCFALYAESPLVALIGSLTPGKLTPPQLLGLLAGQLLDEELSGKPRTYADSVRLFFKRNAMNILGAGIGESFHKEAQKQKRNISLALNELLPRLAPNYDRRQTIVEPSFVCERLGLQGRMDFLQLDHSVLIEQKSGKAGFDPHALPTTPPLPREEHCAQMHLYLAILRYGYPRHGTEPTACLLYSKYLQPLLPLQFSERLLFRALSLRNRMASQDLTLASEGFDILTSLTPETLKEKHISSKLWEQSIRPELNAVLAPISQAPSLERLYFLRLLRFVAGEHRLSKLGADTPDSYGLASLWLSPLEEKRSAGNIFCGLTLHSPLSEGIRVAQVTLAFPASDESEAPEASNFRTGDIVMLYPYGQGEMPDVRKTIVFRGTIASMSPSLLCINLRNEQTDAIVFVRDRHKLWAVEHDFMEASFKPLYTALHAFLTAPEQRRDLLMLRRKPRTDDSLTLQGDYGPFNSLMLSVKRAKELFLIVGPPGTGKTSYGLLYTLREELLTASASVLLTAYTNRAVDEICSKLEGVTDYLRIGSPVSCPESFKPHLLGERIDTCATVEGLRQLIASTRVFVGTVSSLISCPPLFQAKRFSLAIVDEASQILEPHLLGLLSATQGTRPAIDKFVLIGDHKQLPAVVRQNSRQTAVSEPALQAIGLTDCRASLFERLLRRYHDCPSVAHMLTSQGRMHPDLAAFPSLAFYASRLTHAGTPHQLLPSPSPRLRFIDVQADTPSATLNANTAEAQAIATLASRLLLSQASAVPPPDLSRFAGIIVPYRSQISAIRQAMSSLAPPELALLTVDTVERYQGSQRKHIIYGFTAQRTSQLSFLAGATFEEQGALIDRKLNVALTRAEETLTLVGDSRILSLNPLFSRLIDYVKDRGGYLLWPAG